jgi:glycosyltransferase involved in cell wall biosynthesis
LPYGAKIARLIEDARPDSIHIATEGPIGFLVRRYCRKHGLPFTSGFHTRFPEYVSARLPVRESWIWAALRAFHRGSQAVMAATPALASELCARGFRDVVVWPRGVDTSQFHPRTADLGLPRPVFLCVGRVAVEKNLEAFLDLDLPGTKVIVGDGPARAALVRKYPQAVFLGARQGEELAETYAAADVFVFPSKTDTFGLVLLEALASGVPVAAFPVTGPRDVLGSAPVGALSDDLQQACLAALRISPQACLEFAANHTWEASARAFIEHMANARTVESKCDAVRGAVHGRAPAQRRVSLGASVLLNQNRGSRLYFDAFSAREPGSTSLENAMVNTCPPVEVRDTSCP